jgi:hypothetical protein
MAFCEESGAQGVWCLMAAPANGNVALECYDVGLMLLVTSYLVDESYHPSTF